MVHHAPLTAGQPAVESAENLGDFAFGSAAQVPEKGGLVELADWDGVVEGGLDQLLFEELGGAGGELAVVFAFEDLFAPGDALGVFVNPIWPTRASLIWPTMAPEAALEVRYG